MNCSCICSWAGELFSLKPLGEEASYPRISLPGGIPMAHKSGCELLESSAGKKHSTYSCWSWPQLSRIIYIAWKPQKRAYVQLILLNCYFQRPQPQESSRGLSHSNFLIHVKQNRRKTGQRVHAVKL